VSRLHEAACESIPEVSRWLEWCHPGYSVEESRTWVESRPAQWEQGTSYDFSMVDPKSGEYLGGCGINDIHGNHEFANLGYWVKTSRTRQGIATQATLLLARFGFQVLRLNRIEIKVDVDNLASQRVAMKAGATREGVARNLMMLYGKPVDMVMFSFIPGDMRKS
jgi:ribosomal-protein-serine acetyltransferase